MSGTAVDYLNLTGLSARKRLPVSPSCSIPRQLGGSRSSVRWIQAPAGFGKSQYLHQLLLQQQTQGLPCSWINCHPGDTDQQLLALLLHADGSRAALELAATALAGEPEPVKVIASWAAEWNRSGQRLWLFIDDAHYLDTAGWQLLANLIALGPPAIQLAVASREMPCGAAAVNLSDEVERLGIRQLTFNDSELQQWLALQSADRLEILAPQLQQRFSGWPAALGIWSACLRSLGQCATIPAGLANFELQDYWHTEVASGLSAEQRLLAQQAAVLGQCSEGLLSDLNQSSCLEAIAELVRQGIFSPADKLNWVVVEPAMVELIRSTVSEYQAEQWHQQAFRWYSRRRQPVRALEHAQKAQLHEELASWVEAHAESLLASLDIARLVAWCDLAGDAVLRQSPRLMQLACWAWLLTYRLRRAESLIRHLSQRRALDELELDALQGYLARLKGQNRSATALCVRALEGLPSDRYSVRFLLSSTLTYLALAETDLDNARAWNRTAAGISRQYGSLTLEALALFDQARIELHRGHLEFSLGLVDSGMVLLESLPEQQSAMPLGRLCLYRGFLLWITGAGHDQLMPLLDRGIHLCSQSGDVLITYGYGLRAMELAARGQAGSALDAVDDVERLLQSWGVDSDVYSWLLLVKANIWIFQQKYNRAQDALDTILAGKTVGQLPRTEIFPMLPDFVAATLARLNLVCGRFDECMADIDEWLRCHSSPMIKLLIQLVKAAALRGKNQIAESQFIFSKMSHLLRSEGVSMQFQAWMPEIYSNGPAAEFPLPDSTRIQLSEREHDVLRKIAEGCSNQEIAAQLYISLHTVKSHARKINVKLGVSNRTQAIRKAREMLLL
ncbi:LuxR C-terminal-related transcriptional regulator [Oceanobacter mangrovi]|uniref:LuxR C-terminal-related transcriptional regulator n=1 Tax=Oceanobacter mangrovi TaxID=2862510 RepID=UPI001C8DC623|nr:LuxR C-terminal-related transcriptional regulator [Oceanobacter mangrovi]